METPPDRRIDLRRLPWPWRYAVALLVVMPIVWIAWKSGRDHPSPAWLEQWLFPAMAWVYIGLAIRWLIRKL